MLIINKIKKGGFVNMKKFLLIGCLVLLMVCFYGCGKAPEAGETSEETTVEETTEEISTEETEVTESTVEEAAEEAPEEAPVPEEAE